MHYCAQKFTKNRKILKIQNWNSEDGNYLTLSHMLPLLTLLLSLRFLVMRLIHESVKTAFYNISRTRGKLCVQSQQTQEAFYIVIKQFIVHNSCGIGTNIPHVFYLLLFGGFLVVFSFFPSFSFCAFCLPFCFGWVDGEPSLFYTYTDSISSVFSMKLKHIKAKAILPPL